MAGRGTGEIIQVLVVENDVVIREKITTVLRDAGIGVRTASNGVTGLRLARSMFPAVAVIDMRLPELDGASVLQELRGSPLTRCIGAFVISSTPDIVPATMRPQCAAVIVTPFDVDDLLRALLTTLRHPCQRAHVASCVVRPVRNALLCGTGPQRRSRLAASGTQPTPFAMTSASTGQQQTNRDDPLTR